MSELFNVAGQLIPYVSGFGASVLATAQSRAAESVVERGRLLIDRVVFRRGDDPTDGIEDSPERQALAGALEGLPEADRIRLTEAVGLWLESGARGQDALWAVLRGPAGTEFRTEAHGTHAVAIGQNIGDINIGRAPGEGGDR
ncbi:hypothetical protein OHA04_14300 [Streptomyces sp. NBC_01590]|uniref:hypothetical protein n=1 Tax=Streptomyces sp. NBC_01590 TaxID=2975887 RepID=UPI003869CA84